MPDQRLRNTRDVTATGSLPRWAIAWLTFVRLRPVHVNGVIFGAFSTPVLGLLIIGGPVLATIFLRKEPGFPVINTVTTDKGRLS